MDVEAAEFVISGKKLFLLACDAAQNLRLYTFDGGKKNQTTWQGKKLMSMYDLAHQQSHCVHDLGFLTEGLVLAQCTLAILDCHFRLSFILTGEQSMWGRISAASFHIAYLHPVRQKECSCVQLCLAPALGQWPLLRPLGMGCPCRNC